ncbi:dipeptidase [Paenibacillus sp. LHD-117]|uniref:dipeptidase n=1 Tax=Paenibacillus sp. LHD-117 TaxID=3071412 RepID=UPI0027DF4F5B|nr:dipeptidase [Paenibacillus sp. LHD-117]MDQ6419178.1 dipeptidase [Paenibacillus sp. LHD-117]
MIDFHCDVLCKLLLDKKIRFRNGKTGDLDVTYERLRESGTLLQTFAVYLPPDKAGTIDPILESVDLFYEQILTCEGMMLVTSVADLEACLMSGQTGALLSLEGVSGLQGRLSMLRLLYRLGVRAAGLTWNHANWAADGVMEPRGAGLTSEGQAFVSACNELGIIVDVSHLSEKAFWDVAALSTRPIIASHSNARAECDHPRNLDDRQVKALIQGNGRIGLTYVPWFVTTRPQAAISDLLMHVDHVCALGGEKHIMLGSDFDGIDRYMTDLTHPGEVIHLKEALLKRYSATQVAGFLQDNALAFLRDNLPVT